MCVEFINMADEKLVLPLSAYHLFLDYIEVKEREVMMIDKNGSFIERILEEQAVEVFCVCPSLSKENFLRPTLDSFWGKEELYEPHKSLS